MSATTFAKTDQEDSLFQTSAHALSDAATDARAHAKAAAQNVKDGVGWGVYKAAFGLSFGVVFTGVFLTELLPVQSLVRRGLEDGSGDALDAIEARKRQHEDLAAPPLASKEPEETSPVTSRRVRPVAARDASTPARKRTRS